MAKRTQIKRQRRGERPTRRRGSVAIDPFYRGLKVPEGLTVPDLEKAAALINRWADPEEGYIGDPTGVLLVAKVYRMLRKQDRTRRQP